MWIKVSDDWLDDETIIEAGLEGRALYLAGQLLIAHNLTDGHIKRSALPLLVGMSGVDSGRDVANLLVSLGLWEETDDGWYDPYVRYTGNSVDGRANQSERNTAQYRRWREAIVSRDDFRCVSCGVREHLHVHHIQPYATHPDRRTDTDNGVTLCITCHSREHGRRLG